MAHVRGGRRIEVAVPAHREDLPTLTSRKSRRCSESAASSVGGSPTPVGTMMKSPFSTSRTASAADVRLRWYVD
ncbi:MAG: hypothetical protein ACRYGA_07995 [Janthinobacterium lividum]